MISHIGKNYKLQKAIGSQSWKKKIEMFYYKRILKWKPADIIELDQFKTIGGKGFRKFFDSSISNQPVDFWLFKYGSENPIGIIEVKWHFSKDEFVSSPGNKYAAKHGLPLFVFIIDSRVYGSKIRFGIIQKDKFSQDYIRIDTVRVVGSMDEVFQIIKENVDSGSSSSN